MTAGKLLNDFRHHDGPVTTAEFHPSEFLLTSGSADRLVVIITRRVSREGAWAPPPLEIEKQKKKKGHQSKFKAISPIFCYFFTRKYHLLSYFLSWPPPPPEKMKSKKKKAFRFWAPPPIRIPGHAPDHYDDNNRVHMCAGVTKGAFP